MCTQHSHTWKHGRGVFLYPFILVVSLLLEIGDAFVHLILVNEYVGMVVLEHATLLHIKFRWFSRIIFSSCFPHRVSIWMINANHVPSGHWLEWEPSESCWGWSRAENPVPIEWCSCFKWQTKWAIIGNNLFQFISSMKCNLVVCIWIHGSNYSLIQHKYTMFTNGIWVTDADSFCKTKFK